MDDLLRGGRDLNKIVWKFPLRLGFLRPSYVKLNVLSLRSCEILPEWIKLCFHFFFPWYSFFFSPFSPPKKYFSNTVHRHIRGKRGTVSATKAERTYRSMAKETRKWKFYSNSNYIFRVQRERKRTEFFHPDSLKFLSEHRGRFGVGSLVEDCFGNR